ncbi:hypothetical protein [Streptomyces sp. SP18CS02]|uniref:hypothetical protein n=1 Tax=Streptomyces sp. SP18CS02 TaxID=3002531 RepID=UPI002E76BD3F|nr:hypothetical protein [Streptomyces sp. SP18CS02]MEE1754710.1 hypothetical protein [Streptomyces sp. SP18CS02]
MSEQTPSQAEGGREPGRDRRGSGAGDTGHREVPRTTPSQAEGERGTEDGTGQRRRNVPKPGPGPVRREEGQEDKG